MIRLLEALQMGPQCSLPPPQALLTTSKALRANGERRLLRRALAPLLYEFPIGLKEIDFGKQTTNYKLHGSCFIIQTKRGILHKKLLNLGLFAELMQIWNIPLRCLKLPGCLLQGRVDALPASTFSIKVKQSTDCIYQGSAPKTLVTEVVLWLDMYSYKLTKLS